jgi:CHAT domain-containing protein
MRSPLLLFLILVSSLVGGAANARSASPELQLGRTLGNEDCHAARNPAEARLAEIFCGESEKRVGRLEVTALDGSLPDDKAQRRDALLMHAKTIAAALVASEQFSCDAGRFLGEGDVLLYLCTMQSTSWPQLLMVSGFDRTIAQAVGMPSMLPVLGGAISAALGHRIQTSDIAAGQRFLATGVSSKVLTATTADFARYSQSIETARIYSSRNDFAAAEAALRGALEINTRLFGPDSTPVGLTLMELAVQVSNQGRFDEAAGLFRRASPVIEASVNADARAQLNSYLALDAANQRDFAKALIFARQATVQRRAQLKAANGDADTGTGFSELPAISSGELAHSLRIEAEMALRLDELPDAQAAAEEALWIVNLEPGLALWWRADVLSLIGDVNERRGRIAAAERNYLDAIALQQKMFGESAPLALSHFKMGRFYTDQQRYPQAIDHFRIAMAILSRNPIARASVTPDQFIPFLTAATEMSTGPQQRAMLDAEIFRITQLVNSDVADQAITRASVRLAAANPSLANLVRDSQDAQQMRDQLRINIAAELAKSNDERNTVLEAHLVQQLTQVSARTDALAERVLKDFPDYSRLASPEPVELADMRTQLRQGQAFMSFIIGFRGSFGLLVTAEGLTVKRLDVTPSTITADIALLRRAFVPRLGSLPDFSLRNAYALYMQLLEPFANNLKGINHLVVAPGPILANLPFSLLVSAAPPDSGGYTQAAWLIRRMAISQIPSPRALLSLRQAEQKRLVAPRPFLGLGDPSLTGANGKSGGTVALETLAVSCRETDPISPALLRALPPLPETAAEVRSAAQALGGDANSVLLGPAATETSLRAHPLDQYRVLYFATHGLLPSELHCQAEPGLVLSPPVTPAVTTDGDGLLDAGEVAALKLNADFVVLSACNTAAAGAGQFGGSALEGLADAFFNAGARAVLASHWEVPSVATARLMTDLFKRYGQDHRRGLAEALRQSQLGLVGDPRTAHPFYWAAFTLIGVGDTAGDSGFAHVVQQANGGAP